jgi:glycine cleavage system H protein
MKDIEELTLPGNIRYSKDHEWVRPDGDLFVVGISDYAQDQLGDIVFVELPAKGTALEQGQAFGSVESVKAVSELFAPLDGEVVEINPALEDQPELVNNEPYSGGWMLKIKSGDGSGYDRLLDRDAYLVLLRG